MQKTKHRKGRNVSAKICCLCSSVFEEKQLCWKDCGWFPRSGAAWVLELFRQQQSRAEAVGEEGGCYAL